jgi:hypothetical protein
MEDLFQHFYLRMVTILFISYAKRRISSNEFGQVSLEYPYLFLHPRKLNVHALDMDARSSRTAYECVCDCQAKSKKYTRRKKDSLCFASASLT